MEESMTQRRIALTVQVIAYMAEYGALPGKTRGEIRDALGLPPDIEITARLREATTSRYGAFDIRCMQITKSEYRYWMTEQERQRAAEWIRRKVAA
jgi:hypothetical protein